MPRWVRFARCHRAALRAQPDAHSYRGNRWEHQTVTLPCKPLSNAGENDFGALEIAQYPAIGEPAVCSMSRSKCIVPSVAFAQLRHRAGPNGTNHPANRSHSPLAIGKRSGRLVLTRPAARSIYSASLQTSDEPNDTAALRPEHYGSVWNKASGEGVSVGEAAADLPSDLEGRSLLVAGLLSRVDHLALSHLLE